VSLEARFARALATLSYDGGPAALAVSGGGDSVALMHLFAGWAKAIGRDLPTILIVDHSLRDGSDKDAALAARWARAAGYEAHVLKRTGPRPQANIEEKARASRYGLLGAWCRERGAHALFVAHTLDDQAETFLLRLARGSGVDGLSAMRPQAPLPVKGFGDIEVLRPLLGLGRSELRAYLAGRGLRWLEDPMNADPRFARIRMRALLPQLESAGIRRERIAQAAQHLGRTRAALERQTAAVLADHALFHSDAAFFDRTALAALPREVGLRVLSAILVRVSGRVYRPRFERLEMLYDAIIFGNGGKARTLHSCRIGPTARREAVYGQETLKVVREKPRKSSRNPRPGAGEPAAPRDRSSRSKSPQKGRIIPVSCNS
jgi:tRNA(Ile)-lysidine synthase